MKKFTIIVILSLLITSYTTIWATENSFKMVTTLSSSKQASYKKQIDRAFVSFESRIGGMEDAERLDTLEALDEKLESVLKRRLSEKNRFIFSYISHLVGRKHDSALASSISNWISGSLKDTRDSSPVSATWGTTSVIQEPITTPDSTPAAYISLDLDSPQGRVLAPTDSEIEIARYSVKAIGDELILTDFYVSNAGTANLQYHVKDISLYDGDGNKLASGIFPGINTVRFASAPFKIKRNSIGKLVVKALFLDMTDSDSLGKTLSLQAGLLPGTSATEGTENGLRLVSQYYWKAVGVSVSGSAVGAANILWRASPMISSESDPTFSTHSFNVTTEGKNVIKLTRIYVSMDDYSLPVDNWTLYKEREFSGNEIAHGSGPLPQWSWSSPAAIALETPLEIFPGSKTVFVLSIQWKGNPKIHGKRTFRVVDMEYQEVSNSGTPVTITGLNRYPGIWFATTDQTYSY